MKNKMAVIVLNYFGHKDTFKCIKSIQDELDITIILIDNSENASECKTLRDMYKNSDSVIHLFTSENLGFAGGVNKGLTYAINNGFTQFLLLNNDATLVKGAGKELLLSMKKNPSSLISMAINWDNTKVSEKKYHSLLGLISNNPITKKNNWIPFFTGCVLAFDKRVINKIGLFNEDFFMYGEDVDFCYRAKQANIPLISLDRKEWVIHKGSKSSKVSSLFYEYQILRAHYLLTYTTFSTPLSRSLINFIKMNSLLIRALLRGIRYSSFSPILAFFMALFNLRIRP